MSLRRNFTLWVALLLGWGVASELQAAVTVFHDPTNTGTPGAPPASVSIGGSAALNLYYQTGTTASAPSTACLSGAGSEVCGWDIHVSTSSPSVTLTGFTPDAGVGSDIVWNISGNVLRANGGNPITGETGIRRIGTLNVAAANPGGSVTVTGNLYVTAALGSAGVTTGTVLANSVAGGDPDGDGVLDPTDNCPTVANGPAQAAVAGVGNQTDSDSDAVGDGCDSCRLVANPRVAPTFLTTNVWATITGGQRDDDHDGFGNRCDARFTAATGLVTVADQAQYLASQGKSRATDICGSSGLRPCAIFDLDEGAVALINTADQAVYLTLQGKTVGPKCPTCPLLCENGTSGTCGAIPP